jgi:hypothetical protein
VKRRDIPSPLNRVRAASQSDGTVGLGCFLFGYSLGGISASEALDGFTARLVGVGIGGHPSWHIHLREDI